MTVHSERIKNGERIERPAYATSMFSQSAVIRWTIRALRIVAWALLVMSTFGNYVQFAGGWEVVRWDWRMIGASLDSIVWAAALFAVLYQGFFSLVQWGAKARRWWMLYGFALLASAIPSFMTYNAWAGPYLTLQIGEAFAIIVIGLAVVGADALPEWILVG